MRNRPPRSPLLRCPRRPIWLLALVVLLLAPHEAAAAKKWKGRFAPRKETVHRLVMTTDVEVSAKLPLIGGPEGRLHLEVETTRRVAERRRRGPTSMALTIESIAFEFDLSGKATRYDSRDEAVGDADDVTIRQYVGLLLGRTFTLEVLPTGEVTAVQGIDDLVQRLDHLSGNESAIAPLLDSLTRDLGDAPLMAILQQATPVFPGHRLRLGDTWSRETDLPNPLFESMHSASDYELQEVARLDSRKAARTTVRHSIRPEGQGPLLDQLGRLAGIKGELRLTEGEATGMTTIWSTRKGGLTLNLEMQQSVRAKLSVPVKVLGFTRRTTVPLKVDQRTTLEILAPAVAP